MIKFTKVIVSSFFSLGEIEFDVVNGTYLVYGQNKDIISEVNTSNGAGKTSLFNALYQGLFNKNLKDPKGQIDSVSNLYLGKPYYIEIHFTKNNINYKIINDRRKGKISIYKNDENISLKGISQNLNLIRDIIGFDFQTFTALTFLNQNILDNIIDTTSKNNILYQFFEIDRLKSLEKYIKEKIKDYKNKRAVLMEKEQEYVNYLSIINTTTDKNNLQDELFILKQELDNLNKSKLVKDIQELKEKRRVLKSEIDEYGNQYRDLSTKIDYIETMLKKIAKGICPVCGQTTKKVAPNYEKDRKELLKKRANVSKVLDSLNENLNDIEKNLSLLVNSYEEKKNDLESEIRAVEREIVKNSRDDGIFGELKKNKEIYENKLKSVRHQLEEVQTILNVYGALIQLLAKGYITEVYLKSFINLLKENIKYFLSKTDFTFKININIKRGALNYTFLESGVEKTFGQLSSGEKTRVSLVILLANIRALEQLTGIEVNFLVFDELLGVLDEEGLEFIKTIINDFKKNKAIFIITHHDEITSTYADYIIDVIKENNIAHIKLKNNKEF